jgi:hypothetical protein
LSAISTWLAEFTTLDILYNIKAVAPADTIEIKATIVTILITIAESCVNPLAPSEVVEDWATIGEPSPPVVVVVVEPQMFPESTGHSTPPLHFS